MDTRENSTAPAAPNSGPSGDTAPEHGEVAGQARALVRQGLKAALASLEPGPGGPYASLVAVATLPDNVPLLLISRLARHTRNVAADARASLLFDGTGTHADPLAGSRVSLLGRLEPCAHPAAPARYLARHPDAATYVDFADFVFHSFAIERAHFVGGFGRIVELGPADLMTSLAGADGLLAAEADILVHMNADHRDAISLYAERLLGADPDDWHMTGIDPEGADLRAGGRALRLAFSRPIATPGQAREELARLARIARKEVPADNSF